MSEFEIFIRNVLIPKANTVLKQYYSDYCAGKDIDIQFKSDESPASKADRKAEKQLRALINAQYPDHGIWGEEFGGENLEAEFVWVLDPLDGTKQFLAKQDGCFVVLIGLFKNKRPYVGAASDPLSSKIWMNEKKLANKNKDISQMVIASTAPDTMFATHQYQSQIQTFLSIAHLVVKHRNAKSFLDVIDGSADVGIESSLSLHDIGALIPIVEKSGCIATDFDGNHYHDNKFDFNTKKYDFLVTRNIETTNKILKEINGK